MKELIWYGLRLRRKVVERAHVGAGFPYREAVVAEEYRS